MQVPVLNKQYEKDKLMDLINSSGLTKSEIAKETQSLPHGFGKISIQTMYDLETNKADGKPDGIKLFQIKEILRVIGKKTGKEIPLGSFVSPELSKVRIVLEWNFKKHIFEVPNLLQNKAKCVYFPNWINQNPNMRAIVTYPPEKTIKEEKFDKTIDHQYEYRLDARISLFDISKNDWNIKQQKSLLWRECLAKIKDKNYYYMCLPQKFHDTNTVTIQKYLGYVYREGYQDPTIKYWVPSYDIKKIEFDEIYPVDTLQISLDDENMLLDLE